MVGLVDASLRNGVLRKSRNQPLESGGVGFVAGFTPWARGVRGTPHRERSGLDPGVLFGVVGSSFGENPGSYPQVAVNYYRIHLAADLSEIGARPFMRKSATVYAQNPRGEARPFMRRFFVAPQGCPQPACLDSPTLCA